ncbi:MAG: low-specificity L-threonine aldolase [Nitrospina sp.]|nr:low-specificity L-threonine aldolase [Nitrospina sp.]
MRTIDLRSDTVTRPTPAMREAMARAEVGDDVFDEDPTVHQLQDLAAETLGKPAALFLPSGTMGNLVSVLTHCGRGDEILLGDRSHIFLNEAGGVAAFGGVHPRTLPNNPDGTLVLEQIEQSIRPDDLHFPPTRLICLENTHNFCGGTVLTPAYMQQVARLAAKHGLKVHLDGARLMNAATALGVPASALTADVDSVMISLSKGLSAPVGSLIAGSEEFILKARKLRKMAGGGMRQAGHLAAAGLVSLREQAQHLGEDHVNARALAQGINKIEGLRVDLDRVQTNILFFELTHPAKTSLELLEFLRREGILILEIEPAVFRAVTHREVLPSDIETVLEQITLFFKS